MIYGACIVLCGWSVGCLRELTRLVVQSNQLVSLPWQIGSVLTTLCIYTQHSISLSVCLCVPSLSNIQHYNVYSILTISLSLCVFHRSVTSYITIHTAFSLSVCLSVCLSVSLSLCVPSLCNYTITYTAFSLSVCLSVCLSVSLSVCVFHHSVTTLQHIQHSHYQSVCLSVCLCQYSFNLLLTATFHRLHAAFRNVLLLPV